MFVGSKKKSQQEDKCDAKIVLLHFIYHHCKGFYKKPTQGLVGRWDEILRASSRG